MRCSTCAAAARRSSSPRTSWNKPKSCATSCASSRAGRSWLTGRSATSSGHAVGTTSSSGSTAAPAPRSKCLPSGGSKRVDDYGQYAELELAPGADAQIILQQLVASGARLSRFELMEPSLHKIFLDLVGPEAARAEARANA